MDKILDLLEIYFDMNLLGQLIRFMYTVYWAYAVYSTRSAQQTPAPSFRLVQALATTSL